MPAIPDNWSAEFKDFVKMCLKRDPEERLTIDQVLFEHPFLSGIDADRCMRMWKRDVADFNDRQQ